MFMRQIHKMVMLQKFSINTEFGNDSAVLKIYASIYEFQLELVRYLTNKINVHLDLLKKCTLTVFLYKLHIMNVKEGS